MVTHEKKTPRNKFYIFRQDGKFIALLRQVAQYVSFSTKCQLFHTFMFNHVFRKQCATNLIPTRSMKGRNLNLKNIVVHNVYSFP